MTAKHEGFAREAKKQGAQVISFQELFYGPYFGITEDKKYYAYAEPADGPIVQRFAKLAKEGNTFVVPANLSEVGSIIALATGMLRGNGAGLTAADAARRGPTRGADPGTS